jgi:hypothetical protein
MGNKENFFKQLLSIKKHFINKNEVFDSCYQIDDEAREYFTKQYKFYVSDAVYENNIAEENALYVLEKLRHRIVDFCWAIHRNCGNKDVAPTKVYDIPNSKYYQNIETTKTTRDMCLVFLELAKQEISTIISGQNIPNTDAIILKKFFSACEETIFALQNNGDVSEKIEMLESNYKSAVDSIKNILTTTVTVNKSKKEFR